MIYTSTTTNTFLSSSLKSLELIASKVTTSRDFIHNKDSSGH